MVNQVTREIHWKKVDQEKEVSCEHYDFKLRGVKCRVKEHLNVNLENLLNVIKRFALRLIKLKYPNASS